MEILKDVGIREQRGLAHYLMFPPRAIFHPYHTVQYSAMSSASL